MEEFKDAPLSGSLGVAARFFRALPLGVSLTVGRYLGRLGYFFLPKKRALVYANLKTAFSKEKSPAQLRALSFQVFINLTQSFVELLCIGNMKRKGFNHFVKIKGQKHVDEAVSRGKGVIFITIHSGNWELGSVFTSLTGYVYNVVANEQPKMPQLGVLLNEARAMAGAQIIPKGVATKEIINALKRHETIGLVLDQGGEKGVSVEFFGRTVSMSSGAIRLALKYGSPVCPVWVMRQPDGSHVLEFAPCMTLSTSGDLDADIQKNVQTAARHYENLLRGHAEEYLWFYRVFKYTKDVQVLILDDGNTERLLKSKASLAELREALNGEGKTVKENTISLEFRSVLRQRLHGPFVSLSKSLDFLRNENYLKFFLTDVCYDSLMSLKADVVISCGKEMAGVNYILSKNHQAKSMVIAPC